MEINETLKKNIETLGCFRLKGEQEKQQIVMTDILEQ
tara:strand:+ start:216 stop:326 length:111 start_codon:yes stop_codon:yes gene_type:complete